MDAKFLKEFINYARYLHLLTNTFPKSEKFGMVKILKDESYSIYSNYNLCLLKYHNKTTITKILETIEIHKANLYLCYELGLFNNTKGGKSKAKGLKRYRFLSKLFSLLCKCIKNKILFTSKEARDASGC